MALGSWRKLLTGASLRDDLLELRALTLKYVKDETVNPVLALGRFLVWGVLGSVLVAFGTVLLLLAALRYLQWQFPVFRGTLSFIPYLVVVVLALGVVGLVAWRITAGVAKRRLPVEKR